MGYYALDANTTGASNTASGYNALASNTTGGSNTGFGVSALWGNTTASNNTAVGMQACNSTSTGGNNTGIGYHALFVNTTGSNNVGVGFQSGYRITTGGQNTAVGRNALDALTTGSDNEALGYNSGHNITTGGHNTQLGRNTKAEDGGAQYQIALGYGVQSSADNTIYIGRDTGSNRIWNNFGANATWTRISDERVKKDIITNTDCGLAFINDLRTVTYKFKAPSELDESLSEYDAAVTSPIYDKKLYGFIAQEVKAVMDTHSITDFDGWTQTKSGDDIMQGISYEMFVMPLVKAIQELSAKNEALLARIITLENA
jgi:hypothetical protein